MEVLWEGFVPKGRTLILRPFYFWLVARDAPPLSHTPRSGSAHLLALLSGDRVFKLSLIKDDLYNRSVVWHL